VTHAGVPRHRRPRPRAQAAIGHSVNDRPPPGDPRLGPCQVRGVLRGGQAGPGGRVFRSENGNPIQPSTWWQVWQKVRALSLTPGQRDTPLLRRPYDLRHSGVTWRLNSGVPATEVAAWAGHSVEVLMRVYARCMTGLEDVWISRMDATLHLETEPRGKARHDDGPVTGDPQK
jgi:integrase